MSHKLNRKGFAAIQALLAVVIVAIIGGTGYFVYHANQKTVDTLDQASKSSQSSGAVKAKQKAPVDPTADWVKYDSTKVSFSYPASWVKNDCGEDNILLGPAKEMAGHCQSDNFPEIYVYTSKGDSRANYYYGSSGYRNVTKEDVTIGGATGVKQTALSDNPEAMLGPSNGAQLEQYVFYSNGYTFVIGYTQDARFTDVHSDFELLVNKTLKFK